MQKSLKIPYLDYATLQRLRTAIEIEEAETELKESMYLEKTNLAFVCWYNFMIDAYPKSIDRKKWLPLSKHIIKESIKYERPDHTKIVFDESNKRVLIHTGNTIEVVDKRSMDLTHNRLDRQQRISP